MCTGRHLVAIISPPCIAAELWIGDVALQVERVAGPSSGLFLACLEPETTGHVERLLAGEPHVEGRHGAPVRRGPLHGRLSTAAA